MTFYRRNLPHLQRDYKPHFITFITKNRWTMPPSARDIALASARYDHKIKYALHVAVIMPEHVHLILTPLVDAERKQIFTLSEITKALKSASAHKINRELRRLGAVWQEESFDHVLRSSEGLDSKITYVLENPIRRGLVSDWHDYRWIWYQPFESPFKPPR